MNLILDNIIFSLQDTGGISNYWYQLLKRYHMAAGVTPYVFDDTAKTTNLFRKDLDLSDFEHLGKSPGLVGRYTNPKFTQFNAPSIFHSSYYRYSKNKLHTTVSTVHDFTYEHYFSGIQLYAHTNQKRKALLKSDGIICVSENTKRDMIHFFPELAEKTTTVIPHGVSDTFCRIDSTSLDREKYFEGRPFILYVGDRKALYKNFNLTVRASELSGLPLAIIGGSALSEKETAYVNARLDRKDYLQVSGVSNEHLNEFYNLAHCLVYPSSYEGFGLPLLEAQRAGCPVIAMNASSIPEVVGDSGLLLEEESPQEIANQVLTLMHPDFRTGLIEKGYTNSQKFTWDLTFDRTLRFYEQVFGHDKK